MTMGEVSCEVVIDAPVSTVYELLSDPALAPTWFATEARYELQPGGVYSAVVGGTHPALGEFVEVVPNEKLVFTFGWDEPGHPIPAGSTTVAITLEPHGDQTKVRLVHSGLPDDAVGDHTDGWNHYLGRLSVVSTGGEVEPEGPEHVS